MQHDEARAREHLAQRRGRLKPALDGVGSDTAHDLRRVDDLLSRLLDKLSEGGARITGRDRERAGRIRGPETGRAEEKTHDREQDKVNNATRERRRIFSAE